MFDQIKQAQQALGDLLLLLDRVNKTIENAKGFIESPGWQQTIAGLKDVDATKLRPLLAQILRGVLREFERDELLRERDA